MAAADQLVCGGGAVTHAAEAGNKTVASRAEVRYAVRAPPATTSASSWHFEIKILTVPFKDKATFHRVWPTNAAGALAGKGRVYVFRRSFGALAASLNGRGPAAVTCAPTAAGVTVCQEPGTPLAQCRHTEALQACSAPGGDGTAPPHGLHADRILVDPSSGDVLVGTRDALLRLSADMVTVKQRELTAHDFTRLLAFVPGPNGEAHILLCGTGRGQPRCTRRSAVTLKLAGTNKSAAQWASTGVITRTEAAHGGAIVVGGGSVYTAHHQVPLPLDQAPGANVVTRSELGPNNALAKWTYSYKESASSAGATNNGLFRSTSLSADTDSLWLWQPARGKPSMWFSSPWTKAAFDGYVYFGLYEWDHRVSAPKSRVARVCHKESEPPSDNNFASFVKMDIGCTGGDRKIHASQMTAVVDGGGGQFYAAFTTDGQTSAGAVRGAVVCAFAYGSQPHGVDFEMGGKIDTGINKKSFFGKFSGKDFSCTRSKADAGSLVYVNPKAQTSDRTGVAASTDVLLQLLGAAVSVTHLAFQTVKLRSGSAGVLWAVDQSGKLHKILTGKSARVLLTMETGLADVAGLQPTASHVVLGHVHGVLRVPVHSCGHITTCSQCTAVGDPQCGWCLASASCGTAAACPSGSAWHVDVEGRKGQQCTKAPEPVAFSVVAATEDSVTVRITDTGLAGKKYATPRYSFTLGSGGAVAKASSKSSGTTLVLAGLSPNRSYSIGVRSETDGGRASSQPQTVATKQGRPARARPPAVTVAASGAVVVRWEALAGTNGPIRRYVVQRGGTPVCCKNLSLSFQDDNVEPHTTYVYTVAGVAVEGQTELVGPRSNTTRITTPESAPGAPGAPDVADLKARTAGLKWGVPTQPNGVITQYVVKLVGIGDWARTVRKSGSTSASTSVVLTGLSPDTEYDVAVQAFTAAGGGKVGGVRRFKTSGDTPLAVSGLSAASVATEPTSVKVAWLPPANTEPRAITNYTVRRSESRPPTKDVPGDIVYMGKPASFVDGSLEECSSYYYTVQPDAASGRGPASGSVQVHTGTAIPRDAPAKPMLQGVVGPQSVVVAWVPRACDAARYVVKQRSPGGSTWKEVCCKAKPNALQSFLQVDDLARGEHEFVVQALFNDGSATQASAPLKVTAPLEQGGLCQAGGTTAAAKTTAGKSGGGTGQTTAGADAASNNKNEDQEASTTGPAKEAGGANAAPTLPNTLPAGGRAGCPPLATGSAAGSSGGAGAGTGAPAGAGGASGATQAAGGGDAGAGQSNSRGTTQGLSATPTPTPTPKNDVASSSIDSGSSCGGQTAGIVVLVLLLVVASTAFGAHYFHTNRKLAELEQESSVINMVHGRRISSGQLETNLDQYVRFYCARAGGSWYCCQPRLLPTLACRRVRVHTPACCRGSSADGLCFLLSLSHRRCFIRIAPVDDLQDEPVSIDGIGSYLTVLGDDDDRLSNAGSVRRKKQQTQLDRPQSTLSRRDSLLDDDETAAVRPRLPWL